MAKKIRINCKWRMTEGGWHLAVDWRANGASISEIARRLNVSRSCVRYNLVRPPPSSRHARQKSAACNSKKGHQPHRLSIAKRQSIVERLCRKTVNMKDRTDLTRRQFPSCASIARELYVQHKIGVSHSTVRRDLKALGAKARRRPRGPMRVEGDSKQRVAFARKHKSDDVGKLLFSDEKYFDVADHGAGYEWVFAGQKPKHRQVERFCPKVHVWGVVGVGVRRLVVFKTDRVASADYINECLKPNLAMLKGRGRIFVQDNAGVHNSRETRKFLCDNGVQCINDWPARSPDLNPIENLWAIVQRKVGDQGPKGVAELKAFVKQCWNDIPQAIVDSCAMSFSSKCQRCVANGGLTLVSRAVRGSGLHVKVATGQVELMLMHVESCTLDFSGKR